MEKIPKLKKLQATGATRPAQAHFVWMALAGWVLNRPFQTITYGELAEILGYSSNAGRTLGQPLGIVSLYAIYNGLPPLSCIVVSKNTNLPQWGGMVPEGSTLDQEQAKVWAVKWHLFRAPTPSTFRKVRATLDWPEEE